MEGGGSYGARCDEAHTSRAWLVGAEASWWGGAGDVLVRVRVREGLSGAAVPAP